MENETLQTIPKIDLHCHLDGSLPVTYVKNALGNYLTEADLQVSNDCRNLTEFENVFTEGGRNDSKLFASGIIFFRYN